MPSPVTRKHPVLQKQADRKRERLRRLLSELEARHRQEPAWALQRGKQALRLADALGDRPARFRTLLCLGRAQARQGHLEEAERLLIEARESLDAARDKDGLCQVYIALGAVCFLGGKNVLALEHYDRALACDIPEHKVTIYTNLANLYYTTGNWSKSLHYQQRALRLAEMRGSVPHQVYCLSNIGAVRVKQGQRDEARADFERALDLAERHDGDGYMRCSLLLNLAEIDALSGEGERAEGRLRQALGLAREHDLPGEQARAHLALGRLMGERGHEQAFLHHHYRCRKLARELGQTALLLQCLGHLQEHFERRGAFKPAYAYLKELQRLQAEENRQRQTSELSQQLDAKEAALSLLEEQKTQIERQKQDLERYNRELEQSNRDLEQYAFVVAHDLKEPLRSIASFTSLLERRHGAEMDATAREYMGFIVKSAKRMNALLTELLHYNTLGHRPSHEVAEVEIEYVVQEALHALSHLVAEKRATVMLGNLPRIRMPHDHLLQLFLNLLENALRYSEPDRCRIRIACSLQGGHYRFEVADSGIGIEPDYQQKIFQLFYRLEREHNEGTGIGLALCRKIVALHDGEIGVDSSPGQGSTFWFTIRA